MTMGVLRKGLFLGAIMMLALVSGCRSDSAAGAPKIDWQTHRDSDVDCFGAATLIKEEYDLNNAGEPEVFLTWRCTSPTDPQGHLFEVVNGDGDPATTDPFKLVLQPSRAVVDQLSFCGKRATYRVTVAGQRRMEEVRWPTGAEAPVKRPVSRGCP